MDRYPDLKRQRDLTASKLRAEWRSITQFKTVGQLVAFAGLNPRHHVSGASVHQPTPISKCGRACVRAALDLPAVVALRVNPIIAVLRKLLPLVFGILKSGLPFDPGFHPLTP